MTSCPCHNRCSVCFIDFEAFYDNDGQYIVKEMCIMNVDNMFYPLHYVFKPILKWNNLAEKAT